MRFIFPVVILLFILTAAGCASAPSTFYVQGIGEAAVEPVEEPPPPEEQKPQLPWRDEVIDAEAEVPLANDDSLSPGVRVAAARLEAREQVRTQLREKLPELRATRELMLDEFMRENPAAAQSINDLLSTAEIDYRFQKEFGAVIARSSLALAPIAERVLANGGGYLSETQREPPTIEQLERQAIAKAQRNALRQARDNLLQSIEQMTGLGEEVNPNEPGAKAVLATVLRGAYPVESALTAENNWRIVLETDIEPLWDYIDGRQE